MAKTRKNTSTSRASKTTKKKSNSNWLTSRINFRSKKTQLLFTVLTFAVIGGAYFTYRSFAATPNYVNGAIYSFNSGNNYKYNDVNSLPQEFATDARLNSIMHNKFPNECDQGAGQPGLGGSEDRQSWHPNKLIYVCSKDTTSNSSLRKISFFSAVPDFSSVTLLGSMDYNSYGNLNENGLKFIFGYSFIKDGSTSKMAIAESEGDGTSYKLRIAIYDTKTNTKKYIKTSNGSDYQSNHYVHGVTWSPDNKSIKFLEESSYIEGAWRPRVCTISINGGDPVCTESLKNIAGSIQTNSSEAKWSFDTNTLFIPHMTIVNGEWKTNKIVKYNLTNNSLTELNLGLSATSQLGFNGISPDGNYLQLEDWYNFIETGIKTYIYNVKSSKITESEIGGRDIWWQVAPPVATNGNGKNPQPIVK